MKILCVHGEFYVLHFSKLFEGCAKSNYNKISYLTGAQAACLPVRAAFRSSELPSLVTLNLNYNYSFNCNTVRCSARTGRQAVCVPVGESANYAQASTILFVRVLKIS
ncbi:MAG: hypothetical protein K1X72_06635 [Pyrinomonadaceae bacterium]|nr:hypothetical protein [Pyrinomonadaceae bacterium]